MRFGAPALTSRNFKEADFHQVVDFVIEGFNLALDIKNSCEGKDGIFRLSTRAFNKAKFSLGELVYIILFSLIMRHLNVSKRTSHPSIHISSGPMIKEFKTKMGSDAGFQARLSDLRNRVEDFAETFPMPGYDDW